MNDEEMPPGPVPKEALDYFRAKRLHPAFDAHAVWAQEHKYAFTIAKMAEKSVLKDVRDSLDKALEEGVPFQAWANDIKPRLAESGWSDEGTEAEAPARLKTIYQTNMRMARANGQADRAQRVKAVLPYFVYELGPSKVHRVEHEQWEDLTLPVDDPFWETHYPPSAWGCRCRLRQITEGEADEGDGPDDSPDVQWEEYELEDGTKGITPEGVDPGFAYPKGSDGRERALNDALENEE